MLHRLLDLFEGPHLDLPHALTRHAEFIGQLLECDRVIGQASRLEDAPLALIENIERPAKSLMAIVGFLLEAGAAVALFFCYWLHHLIVVAAALLVVSGCFFSLGIVLTLYASLALGVGAPSPTADHATGT